MHSSRPPAGRVIAVAAPLFVAATLGLAGGLVAPSAATPAAASMAPSLAAAEADVRWSVAPADEDGPDGRISLRHVVDAGESVRDRVAVTNLGQDPATFTVVAGDGVLGENGAFDIATGAPEEAGAWVRVEGLDNDEVTVDAGDTRVLPVEISVPADATPGDRPAGLVVARTDDGDALSVTHRIGVRLHLQVAGDLDPRLEVSDVETSFSPSLVPFAPGTLTTTYTVANAGNVRLGAGAEVSSGLPFGLLGRTAVTTQDELLPGDEVRMSTTVRAWPTFVATGGVQVRGIVVGEDVVGPSSPAAESFVRPAVSWTGLLVIVVVAALAWRRVRARRAAAAAASPTAPRETAGV